MDARKDTVVNSLSETGRGILQYTKEVVAMFDFEFIRAKSCFALYYSRAENVWLVT